MGLFTVALLILLPLPADATWPDDPTVNLPVCTAVHDQQDVRVVSDGAGGALLVWLDKRSGIDFDFDIYAQHVTAAGVVDPVWPPDGVAVLFSAGTQEYGPRLVADGAGGAIVAYVRIGQHVYVQHVTGAGVIDPAWPSGGVSVCTPSWNQEAPQLAPDGAGGAIIVWLDARGPDFDVYAQHVTADGVVDPAWPIDGVAVAYLGVQGSAGLVPDGAGGAIVCWRSYLSLESDIYAQHVTAAGVINPLWPSNGVAVCTAAGDQYAPQMISDGAGGAIITWYDGRGPDLDMYAQHVTTAGVVDPDWPADGFAVSTAGGRQWYPQLIPDGAGGAIIVWEDDRSGAPQVYAQHATTTGIDPTWPVDGVIVSTVGIRPRLVADGAGGAVLSWWQGGGASSDDVFAQHLTATGAVDPAWPAYGVALCTAADGQQYPRLVSDGAGGAIVAWQDRRSGTDLDIYAQRVDRNGLLGGVVGVSEPAQAELWLGRVTPNPAAAGEVIVTFTLSSARCARLDLLDVSGRLVASHNLGALGVGMHRLSVASGVRLAPGVYLIRLRQGAYMRVRRAIVLD